MLAGSKLRAIMEAAERAAASSDYAAAERLLREAAALQEHDLGPAHPDLANTLNNLGVVCERTKKPDEAERCYRRAYSIATSALPPDHPFVATSRQNLEDFCSARGRSIEPLAAPAARGPDPNGGSRKAPAGDVRGARAVPVAESPSRGLLRVGVVTGSALVIAVVGWMAWPSPSARETRTETPEATAPVPTTPAPEPAKPGPAPPPSTREERGSDEAPAVADAQLCRALTTRDEWRCDPIADPVTSGPIYFYTRLASSSDTMVQHRWYFGKLLIQNVKLGIKSNSGGYRTYSRTTISAERAGEWRVELLAQDGRMLREVRFTVR
jgi:Protein of unknown function (DUF2914)/Tetratricopeptide repeat